MVFLFSEFNGDPAIRFFLGGGGLGNVGGGGKRMPDHRIFHRVGPPINYLQNLCSDVEQGFFHSEKTMTCSYAIMFAFIMLVK